MGGIATFLAGRAELCEFDRPMIYMALNWFEEVKERVPVP
jgi:hypothetical protein